MQQATKSSEQSKVDAHVQPVSVGIPGSAFVINLCSSTSPVALSPPDHAGLKRFTFFVSRRREEGRERFRLHMGYFQTQEEAEKLLDIVREIYPGAWAGMAPGLRLRAAAAAAKEADIGAPIEQEIAPGAATAAVASATPAAAAAAAPAPVSVSVASVASVPAPASPPAPSAQPVAANAAHAASMPLVEISFDLLPSHLPIDRPDRASKPAQPTKPVDAAIATDASMSEEAAAARSLSDVRAAIASLADTSTRGPMLRAIPELQPPANIPVAKAAPLKVMPELSDEAAMAVLESRAQPGEPVKPASHGAAAASPGNGANPEKAVYAVQLMWSVQPIDIAQVPQLAIFSAYTLYGAEGNRDGRRWYGLRLGFFTDAVSAKQVAHYVRSEFSTVSVVPVTPRERERAKIALARSPQPAAPVKPIAATAAAPASVPNAIPGAATSTVANTVANTVASVVPAKPAATASAARSTQFEFIEDKPMVSASPAG
jgi:hypothetical protein